MDGHLTKYLFYEKTGKSQITIPRKFLEAEKIDWNHNDDLYLIAKTVEGKRIVCISKKED